MPAETSEQPKVDIRKCPMCDCHALVPLCFFHWKGEDPKYPDTYGDSVMAAERTEVTPCDMWACIVCGARTHLDRDRVWLPGPDDLKLEDFQS